MEARTTSLMGAERRSEELFALFTEAEQKLAEFCKGKTIVTVQFEWKEVEPMLRTVELAAIKILEHDVVFATENGFESKYFNSNVYQFVGKHRRFLVNDPSRKEKIAPILAKILKRAFMFFEACVKCLSKLYPIVWRKLDGRSAFKTKKIYRGNCQSVLSCYIKIYTYIGDCHRYNFTDEKHMMHASDAYTKCIRMNPNLCRPFMQMSIISKDRNDFVSSMYNLTRANDADDTVDDVRIALHELYDQAHRIYKRMEASFWYARANKFEREERRGVRRQVWLYSMGTNAVEPSLPENPDTKEIHFQNMPIDQVYSRFALTYANYIGKLFTHIGTDQLDESAEEALVYFERLFQNEKPVKLSTLRGRKGLDYKKIIAGAQENKVLKQKCYIPALRIAQIMIINMSMLDRLHPENTHKGVNPPLKYFKFKFLSMVQFAMEMFGVMAGGLLRLVQCLAWDDVLMESACVGLHIWCGWMKLNVDVWRGSFRRPKFAVTRIHNTIWRNGREPEDDVWLTFASLITRLEPLILERPVMVWSSITESQDDTHKTCISPLPECVELSGVEFFKESDILSHEYYSSRNYLEIQDQNFIRMKSIHTFGSEFMFTRNLKFFSRTLKPDGFYSYKSLVMVKRTENPREMCGVGPNNYLTYTLNYTFVPPLVKNVYKKKGVQRPDCNNSCRTIVRRPKKKTNHRIVVLPKRPRMPLYENWLYFSDKGYRTEILVEPVRLVIDTNCFVRKLICIKMLLKLIVKPIYLPVAVILELRGLARGGFTKKDRIKYGSIHNPAAKDKLLENEKVAGQCQEALALIDSHMEYFQLVTSTGKILKNQSVYEYVVDNIYDPKMTNDDRILDTCKYLEAFDFEARKKDCPRRIYRKTLLVTGDRNLRLKSQSLDIPTRPLSSTVFWYLANKFPDAYARLYMEERKIERELLRNGIFNIAKRRGKKSYPDKLWYF